MQQAKSHKDLEVWRAAVRLAKETYQVTDTFPRAEQFGLVLQMRRSAVSIPSNIAEGAARQGKKELIHYLYIAAGSASELDTQVEIALLTQSGGEEGLLHLQREAERVAMMLRALIKSLKAPQRSRVANHD